jgi:hypothetical protein
MDRAFESTVIELGQIHGINRHPEPCRQTRDQRRFTRSSGSIQQATAAIWHSQFTIALSGASEFLDVLNQCSFSPGFRITDVRQRGIYACTEVQPSSNWYRCDASLIFFVWQATISSTNCFKKIVSLPMVQKVSNSMRLGIQPLVSSLRENHTQNGLFEHQNQ